MGFIISMIFGCIIILGRGLIAEFYTSIDEIREESQYLLVIIALYYQLDAAQCVSSGILRGLGKTVHATIVSFVAYYIVTIPLWFYFAFHLQLGLLGLWIG